MKWESIKLKLQNHYDQVRNDGLVERLENGSQPRFVMQFCIIFKIFAKCGICIETLQIDGNSNFVSKIEIVVQQSAMTFHMIRTVC